jgi:hypothetical protein
MVKEWWVDVILRIGVAFVFLYPAIDAIFAPDVWLGYFPSSVQALTHSWGMPDPVLLHSFGAFEAILALWILSGKRITTPSVIATILLLGIVFFTFNQFEIVFRDLGLAAMTLALAATHRKDQH